MPFIARSHLEYLRVFQSRRTTTVQKPRISALCNPTKSLSTPHFVVDPFAHRDAPSFAKLRGFRRMHSTAPTKTIPHPVSTPPEIPFRIMSSGSVWLSCSLWGKQLFVCVRLFFRNEFTVWYTSDSGSKSRPLIVLSHMLLSTKPHTHTHILYTHLEGAKWRKNKSYQSTILNVVFSFT